MNKLRGLLAAVVLGSLLASGGVAVSQTEQRSRSTDVPQAEFHLGRLGFPTNSRASSRGVAQPMWRVDYPDAESFFLPALARYTTLSVAPALGEEGARHFYLSGGGFFNTESHIISDDRLFQYPFLWLQEPAAAGWNPTQAEAGRLREYLERGGFLLIDDFHGNSEFYSLQAALARVFPDREITEIPQNDPFVTAFFEIPDRIQIPGQRHLNGCAFGDQFRSVMSGQPYWLGIYDDQGRLMVGILYNIDMGDAWEHADDPCYPAEMTGQAYRLGVNFVIYSMTH
jgi:hypothetical protein